MRWAAVRWLCVMMVLCSPGVAAQDKATAQSGATPGVAAEISRVDDVLRLQNFVAVIGEDDPDGRAARDRMRLLLARSEDEKALDAFIARSSVATDIALARRRMAALQVTGSVAFEDAEPLPAPVALARPDMRPPSSTPTCRARTQPTGQAAAGGGLCSPRIGKPSPLRSRPPRGRRMSVADSRAPAMPRGSGAGARPGGAGDAATGGLRCGPLTPACARNEAMCGCEFGGLR